MKKLLLSLFTLSTIYCISQGSISLSNAANSQTIAANSVIDLSAPASSNKQFTFDLRNIGSTTNQYVAKRYDVTLNAGATAYYCFAGTCYGPSTILSPTPLTLTAGQSASGLSGQYNMLVSDLDEGATVGLSLIKYTFMNVANNADSIQVSLRYNDPTVGVEELTKSLNTARLFPNPASDVTSVKINSINSFNGNLSIYNAIGSLVASKEIAMDKGENKIPLNIANLNSGIYFISIKSGEVLITKKLIVK